MNPNAESPSPAAKKPATVVYACSGCSDAGELADRIARRLSREGTAEERYDAVRVVADAHDASPAQVRVAWTLYLGGHVLAIPGTGDLGHLEQNVAAAALQLTGDDLAALATLPLG